MELGNLAEIAAVVIPIVAATGGVIWWVAQVKATITSLTSRVSALESRGTRFEEKFDRFKDEVLTRLGAIQAQIATKQEKPNE